METVFKSFSVSPEANSARATKLTEIVPKRVVDSVLSLLGIERPDTVHTLNDAGNGRRLVEKHMNIIRFRVDDREWYVWDGVRWRKDTVKRIGELAKGIAADMRQEATNMKPPTSTGDEGKDKEALARYVDTETEIWTEMG